MKNYSYKMSQEKQFNDLVKKMLDFGHTNTTPDPHEKTTEIELKQGESGDIILPEPTAHTPTKPALPRRERREQERLQKRLEKVKNNTVPKNAQLNSIKLQKAKDEMRKSIFSDEDRKRIERVLFNKPN